MKIEVSNGEIADKLSILQIKMERITDKDRSANIKKEYELILRAFSSIGLSMEDELFVRLKAVNVSLWNIENKIRLKEKEGSFDEEFIELARSVYKQNDLRSKIKKEIDESTGSWITEEKSYPKL